MDYCNGGPEPMGRTSIKNKLILSFLALLLILLSVVGFVNYLSQDFYLAQAISAVMALASGIIFGSMFSESIVKRLQRLSNVASEISNGDLSKEISLDSHDEVRDLEEVFAKMLNDLRVILSEMNQVSTQIQQTNKHLGGLISEVLSKSHEIDEAAAKIARGSEDQTMIVQKTAVIVDKGLERMDEMVKKSARTVSKIAEAQSRSETGEKSARETLKFLDGVLKQLAEYAEPVHTLSREMEKIKTVVNVMDELSQKTDLLSLNASIEATRAGEFGKGFALVANEIRAMSENSRHSTKEIGRIVENVFKNKIAAIESLEKSEESIAKGREIINNIVSTFEDTLSGVRDIFYEVEEVEKLTLEQVNQMKGIQVHFHELSVLARENFVLTQKTTIGTKSQEKDLERIVEEMKSLDRLSEKMLATQKRFRLPVK